MRASGQESLTGYFMGVNECYTTIVEEMFYVVREMRGCMFHLNR